MMSRAGRWVARCCRELLDRDHDLGVGSSELLAVVARRCLRGASGGVCEDGLSVSVGEGVADGLTSDLKIDFFPVRVAAVFVLNVHGSLGHFCPPLCAEYSTKRGFCQGLKKAPANRLETHSRA